MGTRSVSMRWVCLVVAAVLLSSCNHPGETTAPGGATVANPETAVASTMGALSVTTAVVGAGGPCLDESGDIGDTSVRVQLNRQVVVASFGHGEVGPCPGQPSRSVSEGDGFYVDLGLKVLNAEPGDVLEILAPGYEGAEVSGRWSFTTGSRPEAEVVAADVGTWTVVAPTEPGLYELILSLDWLSGQAEYAVMVAVYNQPESGSSLVPIEAGGDPAISPAVVPHGFAACGATSDGMWFCDDTGGQRSLVIRSEQHVPRSLGEFPPIAAEAQLPGAVRVDDTPLIIGVYTSADTMVTVTSAGLTVDETIAVARTIPVFDFTTRDQECVATSAMQLADLWWKCQLMLDMPEPTPAGLGTVFETLLVPGISYRFRPVLPGAEELTTGPIFADMRGGYGRDLDRWERETKMAAEALGVDMSPIADGTYRIADLTIIAFDAVDRALLEDALEQLTDLGYTATLHARVWQ